MTETTTIYKGDGTSKTVGVWPKPLTDKESADLDQLFMYHKPREDQIERYSLIRAAAREFAVVVLENTPRSADQSAALRQIRLANMTANASIAITEANDA